MEQEILDFINNVVRAERGSRVTLDSKLQDTNLDSFGYTVFFIELDEKYKIFRDVPKGIDPFSTIDWENITIKEVIKKCM